MNPESRTNHCMTNALDPEAMSKDELRNQLARDTEDFLLSGRDIESLDAPQEEETKTTCEVPQEHLDGLEFGG